MPNIKKPKSAAVTEKHKQAFDQIVSIIRNARKKTSQKSLSRYRTFKPNPDNLVKENDEGELEEKIFYQKDFEKKFFSEKTNKILCKTFLENAIRDPLSNEIGKSIAFCVSQNHASKITQTLNI